MSFAERAPLAFFKTERMLVRFFVITIFICVACIVADYVCCIAVCVIDSQVEVLNYDSRVSSVR